MDYRRYAIQHILRSGLPTTIRVSAPCPISNVAAAFKKAAADLEYSVDVVTEVDKDTILFHVSEKEKQQKEKTKEFLTNCQFSSYSEYVRRRFNSTLPGLPVTISHMGMPRRNAHATIRYVAKGFSCRARIKKIDSNTSRVTLL